MVTNDENLRQQVFKAREKVQRKIARIRRATGAQVRGTEFDPRRGIDAAEVRSYSRSELHQHLYELNNFLSRGNQFVAGSLGAPLQRDRFSGYKTVERSVSNKATHFENVIGSLNAPGVHEGTLSRETLGEQQSRLGRHQRSDKSWSPYNEYDRSSSNIRSNEKLTEYQQDLQFKNSEGFLSEAMRRARAGNAKALQKLGMEDETQDLTDFQFAALWWGSNYRRNLFPIYDDYADNFDLNQILDNNDLQIVESRLKAVRSAVVWAHEFVPEESEEINFGVKDNKGRLL